MRIPDKAEALAVPTLSLLTHNSRLAARAILGQVDYAVQWHMAGKFDLCWPNWHEAKGDSEAGVLPSTFRKATVMRLGEAALHNTGLVPAAAYVIGLEQVMAGTLPYSGEGDLEIAMRAGLLDTRLALGAMGRYGLNCYFVPLFTTAVPGVPIEELSVRHPEAVVI